MLLKMRVWATDRKFAHERDKGVLLEAAAGRLPRGDGGAAAAAAAAAAASVSGSAPSRTAVGEPPTSPVHLWKRDAQSVPLISTQSGQNIVVAFPDSLEPTMSNFTNYLEGLHGTKPFPGHTVRKMPYRQSASCQDERHIVEAMATVSLGVVFLHNFNVGGDMLIHTLFSEQISLVDAIAEASKSRIARGSMRLLVVSVENPYDLRFLLSTAAGGGTAATAALIASFVAIYDSGRASMARLAHDLENKRDYVDPYGIFDVGLERRPAPRAPLARGRPCPKRESFQGNDPADHKNKWKLRPSLKKTVRGNVGESCTTACKRAGGMQCDAVGLYRLNSCEKMEQHFVGEAHCAAGCKKVLPTGAHLPCRISGGADPLYEEGICLVDAELAKDTNAEDVAKGRGGPRLKRKVEAYMEARCGTSREGTQRLCACVYAVNHGHG